MKRIHNWHKMVPTPQQIRYSKTWLQLSQAAHDASTAFFHMAYSSTGEPAHKSYLTDLMYKYYHLSNYCQMRSDMSLIINEK